MLRTQRRVKSWQERVQNPKKLLRDPIYHAIVLVGSCSLVLARLHLSQVLKTKE
jgi:hypothetical protein